MENENGYIRPVVMWFAKQMEDSLRRNDHKSGWSDIKSQDLINRIFDELDELVEANNQSDRIQESIDVANFAMMVADNEGPKIGNMKSK